jgi:RHS repeat-associated protein
VQEDHYYPFGLQLSGQGYTNTSLLNKYLFNGKEKQDQTGMYDYGFRQLDPVLGRWFCVDRMAEKYLSTSPYVYAGNDPINNVDVMGLSWGSHFKGWIKEETHQFGNYIKEEGDQFGDYQRKHNFEDVAVSLTNPFTFVSYLSSTVDAIHNKDWSRLDPTFRGTIINNSSLIQGGLWRSVFSLKLSTMVYGSVGYGISQFYNNIGQVKNVGYFHGATVVQQRKFGFDYAMTLGNFIMGKTVATSIRNSPDGLSLEESVLLHEYGHYQQSLHFDIIDYTRLCINSVAHNSELDKKAWSERDASLRGLELARDLEITTTGYGERTWPEKLYRTEWTGDWDAVSKSLIFYMNWAGHR